MPTVAAMDFGAIKESIKSYLSSQDEFKDYNWTGSGMSVLLDALAWTAHYMMVYGNMAVNESFLDSAQIRSSVVSKAKALGYMPYQHRSAKAIIRLETNSLPIGHDQLPITIPQGAKFAASSGSDTYNFVTTQPYTIPCVNGKYTIDVELQEGSWIVQSWVYDTSVDFNFTLAQPRIDTNFLNVTVAPNQASSNQTTYTKAAALTEFGPTAKLFFLQETFGGQIELIFGDGFLAQALTNGSYVTATALSCNGTSANGINTFGIVDPIDSIPASYWKITTLETASGGGDAETIESIKAVAPRNYQRQNRDVNITDYAAHLFAEFGSWIQAMNTWGGEDNEPPQYGKVYISIKPPFGVALSPSQKEVIIDAIKTQNIVGIVPEIVDPTLVYVDMNILSAYKPSLTTKNKAQIENAAKAAAINYFTANTLNFKAEVRYSKLVTLVDAVDASIEGSKIVFTLHQGFYPIPFATRNFNFDFKNAIQPNSVRVGPWTATNGTVFVIRDDSNGVLNLYGNDALVSTGVGTANYAAGTIVIPSFAFGLTANTKVKVSVLPENEDLSIRQNYLLAVDTVTATAVSTEGS